MRALLLSLALAACGGATATTGVAPAEAGACVDCFTLYDLHWGMDGGLVAYVETSRLGPCRSYTHERTGGRGATATLMCQADVPGCPTRTISDIARLVGDPDVESSMQKHALYGTDSRPVDGQVFGFGVGGDYVDVGSPCGQGATGCVAIPASVAELVDLLQGLDRTELATEPCKSVFGG